MIRHKFCMNAERLHLKLAIAGDFEGNVRFFDVNAKKQTGEVTANPEPSGS